MIYESEVLTKEQVNKINHYFDTATLKPGKVQYAGKNDVDTSTKDSYAMENTSSQYRKSIELVQQGLRKSEDFNQVYLLKEMTPPIFSEYREGGFYKTHIDDVSIGGLLTHHSMSIFLSEPDEYEGGQLAITLGDQEYGYKPAAGTCLIYPTGLRHQVLPVTSGRRRVAILWGTSIIDDSFMRYQLLDMSKAIRNAALTYPGGRDKASPAILPLEQIRANFIREYGNL